MKILIITQYFWPEQFKITDLCQELINRGHEVTVYTGLPNYPEGNFFNGYSLFGPYREMLGEIKIIRSPLIPRGKKKSLLLALNFFSFFFFASILAPFKVHGKYDRIFVYEPSPITVAIPAIVLKWFKRTPVTLWVQDLWPESLEATGVVKNKKILRAVEFMVKWIYSNMDLILVTSKGFIPKIKAMGIPEKKLKYWPQWAEAVFGEFEVGDYHDERIPKNVFKIMFAGNIGSAQDFSTIVETATLLKGKDIHFVILGDGQMRSWAEGEIQKRGLQNIFHFLGKKPVEMMPYYFSQADVMLVSLTDTELFSITVPAKIQAYLASGKPILASLNGEGASIVEEWKAGKSAPAGKPELLAKVIVKMAEFSPETLKLMGENARRCYLAEFEREKLITVLEEELKALR